MASATPPTIELRVERLENDVHGIYNLLTDHGTRLEKIETDLQGITTRLDGIDSRLDGMDSSLQGVATKVDEVLTILRSGQQASE